jgi:Tfp pilus assembly protein PilE
MSSAPYRSRDSGISLIELVLTVALGALLATAASTGITTMLRVGPKVTQAITDAESQSRLVTYFQQDVRATAPSGVDLSATAGGCSGADPGANVLQLTWADGAAFRRVSYRLRSDTSGGFIERRACVGPTLGSLANGRTARVVAGLATPPPGWAGGAAPAKVTLASNTITLELTQTRRVIVLSGRLQSDLAVLP